MYQPKTSSSCAFAVRLHRAFRHSISPELSREVRSMDFSRDSLVPEITWGFPYMGP